MSQCRVYEQADGPVVVVYPAPKNRLPGESEADWYARTMARAEEAQPHLAGRPFVDLDSATLPRASRHAWRLRGGRVVVDAAVPAPSRSPRSEAIAAATTLDQLKAALLRSGR